MGVGGSDDRFWHSKHFLYVVLVMSVLVGITALGGLLYFFTGFGGEAVAGQAFYQPTVSATESELLQDAAQLTDSSSVTLFDRDGDGYRDNLDCAPDNRFAWSVQTIYFDSDGDGYGGSSGGVRTQCLGNRAPSDWSFVSDDCDDADVSSWRLQTFYEDRDQDGWGNLVVASERCAEDLVGYTLIPGDPDDSDSVLIGEEICGDGIDNDLDLFIDNGDCGEGTAVFIEGEISSCGQVINHPGQYSVYSGIESCSGTIAYIGTDDVVIDCQHGVGDLIVDSSSTILTSAFEVQDDFQSIEILNCNVESFEKFIDVGGRFGEEIILHDLYLNEVDELFDGFSEEYTYGDVYVENLVGLQSDLTQINNVTNFTLNKSYLANDGGYVSSVVRIGPSVEFSHFENVVLTCLSSSCRVSWGIYSSSYNQVYDRLYLDVLNEHYGLTNSLNHGNPFVLTVSIYDSFICGSESGDLHLSSTVLEDYSNLYLDSLSFTSSVFDNVGNRLEEEDLVYSSCSEGNYDFSYLFDFDFIDTSMFSEYESSGDAEASTEDGDGSAPSARIEDTVVEISLRLGDVFTADGLEVVNDNDVAIVTFLKFAHADTSFGGVNSDGSIQDPYVSTWYGSDVYLCDDEQFSFVSGELDGLCSLDDPVLADVFTTDGVGIINDNDVAIITFLKFAYADSTYGGSGQSPYESTWYGSDVYLCDDGQFSFVEGELSC